MPTKPAPHSAERELGFTIIELVVAMVIALVVLGTVSIGLVESFGNGNRATAQANADTAAANVIDRLGADLRRAMAPGRELEIAPDDLRGGLLFGEPVVDYMNQPVDVDDVRQATPEAFWFYSDVVPEAAGAPRRTECVGYLVAPNGALQRTVLSSCVGGTPVETLELLPPPPASLKLGRAVFSYTRMHNPAARPKHIDKRDCVRSTPQSTTFPPGSRGIREVVGVTLDLRSFSSARTENGDATYRGAISLRNRLTRDYLYGLGCAY